MHYTDLPISDGHKLCLEAIADLLRQAGAQTEEAPVVIASQDEGVINVKATTLAECSARFTATGRQDLLAALARGIAKRDACPDPNAVVVLAIDLAGICLVTCIANVLNAPGGLA